MERRELSPIYIHMILISFTAPCVFMYVYVFVDVVCVCVCVRVRVRVHLQAKLQEIELLLWAKIILLKGIISYYGSSSKSVPVCGG